MARKIKKGATDISVILRAIDSTTGAPKTDFAYNTAGIDLWYRRNGATVTSITEATLAAANTAHSDGGVIHLGNGYFRLDSPDAAFATGVNSVMFGGTATGIIIIGTEVQLVNYDPEDAVRLGLTALPNAAADAAGGLPISDAGALDLDTLLATLTNGTYGLSAIETLVDELESRLTATRAGYLDNLSGGAVALASVCTDARLAELGSANLPADIDTLITRLTALRAGYLDNLSTAPPSAPTIRAEIDSNSTKLSDIVADTNEIQSELMDGGRTDLILDSIKLKTDDIATAAAIVDAMLDELLTGHSTPGSVGISITDTLGYVTALRSALTDLRAAALDRIVGTLAAGTHNPQSGDAYAVVNNGTYGNSALETLVDDIEAALANGTYGLNALLTAIGTRLATTGYTVPPTTSQIADAVLDAPLADHLDAGSVGAGINAAGSAGDPWSTTLPGAYGAGTAGKIIGDNVNATISSRSSHSAADVWAVSVRTLSTFGSLVSDIATAVWGAVARTITGGTITTNSDKTGYALTVAPPTAAQVRAEIDSNSTQLAAIVADTAEIQVELADGGRTDLLLDGIKTATDNLATAMTADGAVYKFTANALEEAPGGGTGGDATEAHQLDMIDKLEGLMSKDHTLATAVGTFNPATDSVESIRNRGDAAWITGGGVAGTYAVVINVKDALGVNILDAWVEIWDSAGTAFIEKKQTNSSGNASFNKDVGNYIIRLIKSGHSQTTAEALTISAAGTVNFVMTAFVISAPTNPELCRVYGFFLNPDGTIITGLTGNALVLTYQEDNTVYAGTEAGTYVTTGTYAGMMYFDLARGASATVTLDMINYSKAFIVPELDKEELKNL